METPLSLNSVPSSCGNWSKGTTIYILKVRGITQLSIVHSLGARQDMAVSALTWLAAVRSGVAYFEPRTEAALEEKSQGCKNGTRAVSQSPTGFPSCNHSRSHGLQAAFPNYRPVTRQRTSMTWMWWVPSKNLLTCMDTRGWRLVSQSWLWWSKHDALFLERIIQAFCPFINWILPLFNTYIHIFIIYMFSYSLSLAFSLFSVFNGVLVHGNS